MGQFIFTGGVILISNVPLNDLPQLVAMKTRIPCMHLQVSDAEMRALMRQVSAKGFEHDGLLVEASACLQVCEHLIEQASGVHRILDMRLLENSLKDYLQWENGDAGYHWKDLVATRVKEQATHFLGEVSPVGRTARLQADLQQLQEIVAAVPDREAQLKRWTERTGKSQASFYRRLKELEDLTAGGVNA